MYFIPGLQSVGSLHLVVMDMLSAPSKNLCEFCWVIGILGRAQLQVGPVVFFFGLLIPILY